MRSSKTKKTIQGNSKRQRGTRNTNSPMPLTVVWLGLCHIKLLLGTETLRGSILRACALGTTLDRERKEKKMRKWALKLGKKDANVGKSVKRSVGNKERLKN